MNLFKRTKKDNTKQLAINEVLNYNYSRLSFQKGSDCINLLSIMQNRQVQIANEMPNVAKLLPELFDVNSLTYVYEHKYEGTEFIIPSDWFFMRDEMAYLDNQKAINYLINKLNK